MKELNKVVEELGLENILSLTDIPSIDLYMDQVTQLFENIYGPTKRHEDEKILTKTMINNYAKGKLLFPIKNKRYTKEHLILISLIYQLKGSLSISDVKGILDQLNSKIEQTDIDLDTFYHAYLSLHKKSVDDFKETMEEVKDNLTGEVESIEDKDHTYLEQLLLITSLVNTSNMYRRLAEKLVDQMKG